MKVIIVLACMLLTCGLTGWMLLHAINASAQVKKLSLHVGYAYTLIAFYVLYFLTQSAWVAALCTVTAPILPLAGRWLFERLRPAPAPHAPLPVGGTQHPVPRPSGHWLYPAAISVVLVALAAWPHLITGWGNYWHSGNYDMEDGLNGRDAYLENLIFDTRSFDMGEAIGDKSWYDFAKVTGTLAKRARELDSYGQWFAGDGFRFQFSSQAFWSALLHEPHGLDVLLIQGLLNLVLMAVGLFYLAKDAFGLSAPISAAAALCSVGCNFYLTTYFNGHVGSLIYCSLIPVVIHAALVRQTHPGGTMHRLAIGGLLAGAITFTYPHPLAIISLPLAIHWAWSRTSLMINLRRLGSSLRPRPWLIVASTVILAIALAVVLAGVWEATESYRLRQAGQYRAWGYARDWLIVPLFLGVISPPMEGTIFAGSSLSHPAYIALVVGSSLLLAATVFCFLRAKSENHPRFFHIFALCWVAEYLIFRFFIVDSYYLYKFLYTHQFILVLGIACFVATTRSRWVPLFFLAIAGANLSTNIGLARGLHNRPYNQHPERHRNLLGLDQKLLERSFVDLTGGDAVAVRQILKQHGITRALDPRLADYFIVPANRDSDITGAQFDETLAETGGLALKRAPANNYLMIRTWNEPEQHHGDPTLGDTVFRWMSHGKIDHLGIYIIRPKLTDELRGKFLRICFQKGPSAEGDIDVTVAAADGSVLRQLTLSGGVHYAWIPAEQALAAAQPLVVHSGATGRSMLPKDDRILLYRVFAIGWTDQTYDDQALAFLRNEGADIITPAPAGSGQSPGPDPRLHLGQGWMAYETFANQHFRWVGSPAELVLHGGDKDGTAWVELELEPGPSHGHPLLSIEATDHTGRVVAVSADIRGRNRIVLPLDYHRGQAAVYTLRTKSKNLSVLNDPRILNYRVFRIELATTPPARP
jgi:hypothetical protein